MKHEEQLERLEMLIRENGNLKEKIIEMEDDAKRMRKEVKTQQARCSELEGSRQNFDQMKSEQEWINVQLKGKEQELSEQQRTIEKLQRAVNQGQEEFEQMIRLKEKEAAQERT